MVLNCKTRSLHFSYLGLPIGGESRKIDFWNPLIDCIKSRLPVWKSGNLSIGGRLVFLKFSCLLYRYILFPSSVLPHEENDRLSYSVLVLLYGEEEGIGGVGRRLALVWWKNMYGISEGWVEEWEAWKWRRRLLAWGGKGQTNGNGIFINLSDIQLRYTSSIAYHYLTALENASTKKYLDIIWHKAVPLKISRFVALYCVAGWSVRQMLMESSSISAIYNYYSLSLLDSFGKCLNSKIFRHHLA
ncbi:hypothetical protein MTR_3g465160 [Medicago truncatula]|uniref:Uncharacterized protein n=1 Tax=Medicago truncatula TaxID=3880 RepID=A0A072UXU8_MEDTR|nr:hypothetical protein MTR_3g465160 [Medicago truncatula]